MILDIQTNGVRVCVEDDGNVVVRKMDAAGTELFTVTDLDDLHDVLTMAEVWRNIESPR